MSSIAEPPLDCPVLEKPCTVVLLEDFWLYHPRSWHETFQSSVPSRHGMSYGSLTVDDDDDDDDDDGSHHQGFDDLLQHVKDELPPIHDAVLIARGPIASWMALFYLESFSLLGLVMVDPLQLDQEHLQHETAVDELFALQSDKSDSTSHDESIDFKRYRSLIKEASTKELKLEPNSVPIMVIQTVDSPLFRDNCKTVAERHSNSNGPHGQVPIHQAFGKDPEYVMEVVDHWVEPIL